MLSRLVHLQMISYPMSKPLAFSKWSRLIMSAYARHLARSSGPWWPQLRKRPWSVIVDSLWLFYQKDKSLQFSIFGLNWPFICNKPQVPQFGTSIDWFIGNKKFLSFYFYLYVCVTVNFPQHKTSGVLIEWMWRARRLASEEYNVSLLSFVVGRRDTYSNHQSVEQKMPALCGNSTEDMELFQNTSVQCFVR